MILEKSIDKVLILLYCIIVNSTVSSVSTERRTYVTVKKYIENV